MENLPGVARVNGFGKHVVIAFDKLRTYYDYVADFYPDDGEFGGSGGMYLHVGYSHFVFWTQTRWELDRTILHELTHALLSHLPLPLWLNEGVTQMMEDIVLETSSFDIDHEIVHRHRAYWTKDSIHTFWSGESFHLPDDGQELSYHLAEVLVRNLRSDFPSKILDFLRSADSADAGDATARQVFGVGLANRVEQFLGRGDWQPRDDYDQMTDGPAA